MQPYHKKKAATQLRWQQGSTVMVRFEDDAAEHNNTGDGTSVSQAVWLKQLAAAAVSKPSTPSE